MPAASVLNQSSIIGVVSACRLIDFNLPAWATK